MWCWLQTVTSALFQGVVKPFYERMKAEPILPELNEARLTWVPPATAVFPSGAVRR